MQTLTEDLGRKRILKKKKKKALSSHITGISTIEVEGNIQKDLETIHLLW